MAITYGYSDFPTGTDEAKALATILEEGHKKDLWYISNQDIDAHPRVDTWSNGTDATAELKRMMAIRKFALSRFGEQAIKRNEPMATIEEVLVPLYLHHRYQVEAAASTVGGIYFIYAMRGDGREPVKRRPPPNSAPRSRRCWRRSNRRSWRCRASSWRRSRRGRQATATRASCSHATPGQMFDAITPAVVAADLTVGLPARRRPGGAAGRAARARSGAARARAVIDSSSTSTFGATSANAYEAEIARAVQRVVVERLMTLASTARHAAGAGDREAEAAAAGAASGRGAARPTPARQRTRRCWRRTSSDSSIGRSRPATRTEVPTAPPGAPIGDPGMDWLGRLAPLLRLGIESVSA